MMKITDIEIFHVKVPVRSIAEGGIAPYRGHDLPKGEGLRYALRTIVKVTTEDGIIGWGESSPVISPKIQSTILNTYIKPLLIGKDCYELNKVIAVETKLHEPPIYVRGLFCGIDIACWDIRGKAAGVPVYKLLGGKIRDRINIAYCFGLEDIKLTSEKIRQVKEEGYSCFKTTGGENLYFDIERAYQMKKVAEDDLDIRIDMNEALDYHDATIFLHAVENLELEYVEQPIRVNQVHALKMIRQRTQTPVAINEDCYIPHNLFEYLKEDAIDVAVVDLDPTGGITGIVRYADFSEEAGLSLVHHCGFDLGIKLAAILQVAAARAAFSRAIDSTYMTHDDDILQNKIKIEKGKYIVPDGPGLGIDVDMEKIKHFTIDE
jgi:L-alanine-DL-glutamate epimerase-like enolase superfamily enzyme